MTRRTQYALVALFVLAAGLVASTLQSQDVTTAPGQLTRARVWIENRGAGEAIPVAIQGMPPEALPVRVQLGAVPPGMNGASVIARIARQAWEHRSVTVRVGADLAAELNSLGRDGWEATGMAIAPSGETIVLMKRPQ